MQIQGFMRCLQRVFHHQAAAADSLSRHLCFGDRRIPNEQDKLICDQKVPSALIFGFSFSILLN